jgi:uncharacterized OB-fold protein
MNAIVPELDADSAPFWEALERGELRVPLCGACRRRFFPPMASCPHCGAPDVTLEPASGNGRLYSWVTVHMALDDTFGDDVPYTIVAVELDEGARLLGRLVGETVPPAPDLPVELAPYRVHGQALPGFRIRESA